MMRCGLLGEKLGHSYSPAIHAQLADYAYGLYEVAPEDLPAFLTGGDFDALNVTIPYKKTVIPYCAELSPIAQKLGSVNVLVRRADGTLYGDNADAFGFEYLVRHSGIDVAWQKALVLGNGGASATIQAVLEQLGAHVTVISRHGPDNYDNLDRHADARVIVNTTPVGIRTRAGPPSICGSSRSARACSISSITPRARRCCCRRKASASRARADCTCSWRRPSAAARCSPIR